MILAIDVFYEQNKAKIIGIFFNEWADEKFAQKIELFRHDIAEYEPGAFYKRELPCILDVLEQTNVANIQCIIVDGYVYLDDDKKLGLGGYLYDAINQKVPVIGVAKNHFANNTKYVIEVLRGESQKPLYVTAVGTDLEEAANNVRNMHGAFRFPTLLKELDNLTKQ